MPETRVTLIRPAYTSVVYGFYRPLLSRGHRDATPKNREIKPPLGLMYLASALEAAGVHVEIIDAESELLPAEDVVARVMASKPDFVGITSTTPEFHIAMDILARVKAEAPEVVTMAGGAHVSAAPQQSLEEHPALDYIVIGEGEESIRRIVLERPRERVLRSSAYCDLNQLAPPARHLINYDHYQSPEPGMGLVKTDVLETSRGCPFRCAFCFHIHQKEVRFRDVESVIAEIEKSHRETGAVLFNFFDDTFTVNNKRAIAICDELIRLDLGCRFYCFTRADTLSRELLEKMHRAGFSKTTLGIESGNQSVLDRYRKGTKLEQYERAYRWMVDIGIETRGSFILGAPYETHQTVRDSINFARKLPLYKVGVNILTPYPGTELYDVATQAGGGVRLLCQDWKEYRRWGTSVVETDELSAADMEYYQKKFLREFYGSWKVVFYHLKQFLGGNHSYYFYRPVIYATRDRLITGIREFFRPHRFTPPTGERA